jgi:pectate lyase
MRNYKIFGLASIAVATALLSQQAAASACDDLINDSSVNWRESSLQTDQEIVKCLADSLGTPVGFGENTTGGYDPDGDSHLVVIKKNTGTSVEQQIWDAINTEDHNWIVFDKDDFADETEVAMYRLDCSDADVLSALDDATEAECKDYTLWCSNHDVSSDSCASTFFNDKLNDSDLPIRNKMIKSNTTIDGRGANAYFFFNGFRIGSDSKGKSTYQAENVIITNNKFIGAGHTEDHELDPDMIRSTGESHDIWIHQNTFDHTGDSAFDVKVGAYDITVSFNKLINVKRAALHGSSDSRTINEQITSTIHDNLFVTTDDSYATKTFDTGRRVPLLRRGQSHMFNNVFYGYRKDVLSVRKGGRIDFDNNLFMNSYTAAATKKGDDLEYWTEKLLRDFHEGGLEITNSKVWYSDTNCQIDTSAGSGDLTASYGTTPDMLSDYSTASQNTIKDNLFDADQDLADYVMATAGKDGMTPYVSTYTEGRSAIIAASPDECQE